MSFKKYLKEQELILEKDNRKKIMKVFKFPEWLAQMLHEVHDKYSWWLASEISKDVKSWDLVKMQELSEATDTLDEGDTYWQLVNSKFHILDENAYKFLGHPAPGYYASDVINVANVLLKGKEDEDGYTKQRLTEIFDNDQLRSHFTGIVDWILGNNGQINIKDYTFTEAIAAQIAWHDSLEASGEAVTTEEGEIFKTYPDGFYWIDLHTKNSIEESKAMGHCGMVQHADTIYSLRKSRVPHVTAGIKDGRSVPEAYDGTTPKEYTQLKGRGNKKPNAKYYPYIADMLILHNVDKYNSEYDAPSDFHYSDLDGKSFKRIIEVMPHVLEQEDALLKAFTYNIVDKEQIETILDSVNDTTIQDDNTTIYISELNIHSLSKVMPMDMIIPYYLNGSTTKEPWDFIDQLIWQNILPVAELTNALKYFAKENQLDITETKRYIPDAIQKLYKISEQVKQICTGIVDIISKYNEPYIYLGDSESHTRIKTRHYFEDEFFKIEMTTSDFIELFILYHQGRTNRNKTGGDIINASQAKTKMHVTPGDIIPSIQVDVLALLHDTLASNVNSGSNTITTDFFGDDYEEDIDIDKRTDNILHGIKYEQRRYSDSSRHNLYRRR